MVFWDTSRHQRKLMKRSIIISKKREEYCEAYADNGMKYYKGSYTDIFVSEIELDKEIRND